MRDGVDWSGPWRFIYLLRAESQVVAPMYATSRFDVG